MLKPLNNDLWPKFFEESRAPFTVEDVTKIIDIRSTPFDNDEMEFIGNFELRDGSSVRVLAKYSGTWNAVSDATFCIMAPAT